MNTIFNISILILITFLSGENPERNGKIRSGFNKKEINRECNVNPSYGKDFYGEIVKLKNLDEDATVDIQKQNPDVAKENILKLRRILINGFNTLVKKFRSVEREKIKTLTSKRTKEGFSETERFGTFMRNELEKNIEVVRKKLERGEYGLAAQKYQQNNDINGMRNRYIEGKMNQSSDRSLNLQNKIYEAKKTADKKKGNRRNSKENEKYKKAKISVNSSAISDLKVIKSIALIIIIPLTAGYLI